VIGGRAFLRAHGVFLSALGSALLVRTVTGRLSGTGPFAFLADDAVAAIGFHEAYGLVALAGAALALGASSPQRRALHGVAAALHAFLTTINLAHWRFYALLGMVTEGYVATAMHVVLAGVEIAYACAGAAESSTARLTPRTEA
jgi:hypothetical protein